MTLVDDARVQRLLALAAEPELVADRFELGARLGEGGMGVVFEAWDRERSRNVALKLLRDVDAAASARFDREAAALARLSHPGIVAHVAHGSTAEGGRYLAMERLDGVTLAQRLSQGPLSTRDAARVGHDTAAALSAAHHQGLVHRDIKPSNIFLEAGDVRRLKILDFGLARGAEAPAITAAGSLVGTPSYMAPEQVRGAAELDARADLFALGAVLFECSTGRAPFVGADTEAVLAKVLVEQPPPIRQLCPSAPAALEALIARLLSKDPSRRPRDAAEVVRELAPLLVEPHADTAPAFADVDAATPAGTLIAGKYRVVRALGRGGMGVVLLAWHEALDRHVAIKLLHGGDGERSSASVERLLREARAASRLESEHVARVMDVGTTDEGAPFIVMEHLSGKDLAQVLRAGERLPVGVVLDYVLQAAEAIAEAHVLGVVHRDLKPSNLFLTTRRDGAPLIKVLDFGISKISPASGAASLPGDASITAPDAILGSPLYMSPEQLQSTKRVDARTDIWSLGVVLHELLTGRPPFEADSVLAIGAKIAAGAPAELRERCPDAPEGLAAVVRRCLEKDPARRFGSVAELAQALAPYALERSRLSIERITRVTGGAATGDSAPARTADAVSPPRRRATLIFVIAVLGLAVLFAVWRAPRGADSPAPPSSAALQSPPAALGTPPPDTAVATPAAPAPLPEPAPPPAAPDPKPASATPPGTTPPDATPPGATPPGATPPVTSRPRRAAATRASSGATSTDSSPRAPAQPRPLDPLDPMNPALLSR